MTNRAGFQRNFNRSSGRWRKVDLFDPQWVPECVADSGADTGHGRAFRDLRLNRGRNAVALASRKTTAYAAFYTGWVLGRDKKTIAQATISSIDTRNGAPGRKIGESALAKRAKTHVISIGEMIIARAWVDDSTP